MRRIWKHSNLQLTTYLFKAEVLNPIWHMTHLYLQVQPNLVTHQATVICEYCKKIKLNYLFFIAKLLTYLMNENVHIEPFLVSTLT